MPERLGRALREAVPQTIQNLQGIESMRASQTQRRALDFELKQAQEKAARDNELISWDTVLEGMGDSPQAQKDYVTNLAKEHGIITETGGARKGELKDFLIKLPTEKQIESNVVGLGEINKNLQSLNQQLTTGQIQEGDKTRNINEKEMQNLQMKKKQLLQQQNQYINRLDILQKAPTSPEGKQAMDRRRIVQRFGENSPQVQQFDAQIGTTEEKEFAPDIQTRRNPDTGESIRVDERNPIAVKDAEDKGFFPVGPKQKGFLTEEGKLGAERVKEIVGSSAKARGSIVTLETMDSLLDRFESGKLAGAEKTIQQIAESFGLPIDTTNLAAKEAFLAVSEQLALQSRNMGEGMVLAGQMSDRDVQFLRNMNPQLLSSKGGNKLIIKMRRKIAERQIEVAKLANEFKKKNRGILDPLDFEEFVGEKFRGQTIFGIPEGAIVIGTDKITGLPVYKTTDGKTIIPEF